MNYLKYSYLLFSIAVISGICIFRQLPDPGKEKISAVSLQIVISITFFIIIPAFTIFFKKERFFKTRPSFYLFIVFLVLFLLLAFFSAGQSFSIKIFNDKNTYELLNKSSIREIYDIEISGRISSHPYAKNNNYYFDLNNPILILTDRFTKSRYCLENINDIFISFACHEKKDFDFTRDDVIKITFEDFKTYTSGNGELASVFYAEKAEREESFSFLQKLYRIRQKIFSFLSEKFREYLSYRNYTFASAILLGNQRELSQTLKDSFTKSGLYHMLSISGLHLSILFSIFPFILSKARHFLSYKFKNLIYFLCFLLLLIFNILVGLKAPMMRASVFFIIYSVSRNTGKYNRSINVFFMTLVIMLLICPEFISDAGFILSFTATAGIIIVSPIIKKIIFLFSGGRYLANNYFIKILVINASVNIFILPLSFYYFGGYHFLSFLSNMICAPVFYMILLLLFAGSVSILLMPGIGIIFLEPASWFINLIIGFSYFFSESPLGYMKVKLFNKPLNIFIYYLLLFLILLAADYFLSFKYKMKDKNVV